MLTSDTDASLKVVLNTSTLAHRCRRRGVHPIIKPPVPAGVSDIRFAKRAHERIANRSNHAQVAAAFVCASFVTIPGVNSSVRTGPRSEVTTSSTSTALKISVGSKRCPAALRVL